MRLVGMLSIWLGFWGVLGGASMGCTAVSTTAPPKTAHITILAASSLTDAFTEMGQAFAQAQGNDVDISFNFAGSSSLAVQLREGAVADVFASANETQMQTAVSSNRIQAESIQIFATNQLALIVPIGNPASITSLADLANPGVQLVLAAPGVPARDYSDLVLQTLDAETQAKIYANLVSEGQNVRQVVAQVALGEADAGIVYRSDAAASVADSVVILPFSEAQSVLAQYPIALVADAPQPALADQFVTFVLSAESQTIWQNGALAQPLPNNDLCFDRLVPPFRRLSG